MLLVASYAWTAWAQAVNRHFEPTVRIQTERGHRVIDSGPYAVMRHPGYIGAVVMSVGIALTGPLSNTGAGVLLGWSQSVRLGDRVTISDVTGTGVEISLMQTVLVTDEGRRVFVPNSQMASSIVTNRSIDDPRRVVSVRLPLRLGTPVEEARRAVLSAVEDFGDGSGAGAKVVVDDVTESTAWLSLSVRLPAGSEVAPAAAELRELALAALAREQLLPGT